MTLFPTHVSLYVVVTFASVGLIWSATFDGKINLSKLTLEKDFAATGDSVYTMQAGRYRTLMGLFMKYSGCIIAVHTWGVSDDLSWLTN